MDENRMEGRLAGMGDAGEDHARDPEENDVIAGDQDAGGIKILQVLGVMRPAEGRERPKG